MYFDFKSSKLLNHPVLYLHDGGVVLDGGWGEVNTAVDVRVGLDGGAGGCNLEHIATVRAAALGHCFSLGLTNHEGDITSNLGVRDGY